MALSNFAKALGFKTKKDVLSYAPKDAQWSDLTGERFYKVAAGQVLICDPANTTWHPSHHEASHLTETYFLLLRKTAASASDPTLRSPRGMRAQ
jgi:hypothetical protein